MPDHLSGKPSVAFCGYWHRHFKRDKLAAWVDPDNWMVKNNVGIVGGIVQPPPPVANPAPEDLMFVFNRGNKQGDTSPFHLGVINQYRIEYDLERFRHERYPSTPSRLFAMFLFETRQEAETYRLDHANHVGNRTLKRGLTHGPYVYSTHDSAWIDFLRLMHMIDVDSLNVCWNGYWSGKRADAQKFEVDGETLGRNIRDGDVILRTDKFPQSESFNFGLGLSASGVELA